MNFKTGYKQTEIGVIPEDWEVKTLHDVAYFTNGKAHEQFIDDAGDYIVINSKFVSTEGNVFKNSNSALALLEVGEIAMVMSDIPNGKALAKCFLVDESNKYTLNQRICSIKSNECNSVFLFWKLNRNKYFLAFDSGSGQTNLKKKEVLDCPIALPPLPEQTAIAAALSDVDALMGELDKLIAKKRDIKQATMQQLLTGKKRLAGFSGEWEENKLEKFASFYKGKGLAKNEIDIYGKTPCVHYGELFTQYAESITETHSRTNLSGNVFLSKNNDVLMPTSDVTPNGLAKASCILKDDIILGGDILVIRTNPKEINGTFLSFVIRHSKEKIMQLVTGSTVYHLYASDMKNFIFLIPSIEEQTAIATILSDMDAEINALQQKRDKTAQLKQGMMQELLTGRIRLIIVND